MTQYEALSLQLLMNIANGIRLQLSAKAIPTEDMNEVVSEHRKMLLSIIQNANKAISVEQVSSK